jgi:hypothetical protein
MRSIVTPLVALVAGVVLLIFGLSVSDSLSSRISEALTGTPTDKSLLLIILGALFLLYGGVGTIFNRK